MKFDKDVRRNLLAIAIGTIVLGALQLLVFYLLGKFSTAVLAGTAIGCLLAIFNFFLLAITLQKALKPGSNGKGLVGLSYTGRMLLLLLVAIGAIVWLKVNPFSLLIPLVFPRLVIFVLQVTGKYESKPTEKEEEHGH